MIIDKKDLEVWMISLIGDKQADQLRSITLPTWEEQGFVVNLFDAITPDKIKNLDIQLTFDQKYLNRRNNNLKPFTETEKAIWYSHTLLWEKCIRTNKPFIILEEDCLLIESFFQKINVKALMCFCHMANKIMLTPAAGYIILPSVAEDLYRHALKHPRITYNVDSYIKRCMHSVEHFSVQIKRENRSVKHE
jgi:GR25 family glycosyltransferase involved in LPS biosynthesis